jgi:hypothetical protein
MIAPIVVEQATDCTATVDASAIVLPVFALDDPILVVVPLELGKNICLELRIVVVGHE